MSDLSKFNQKQWAFRLWDLKGPLGWMVFKRLQTGIFFKLSKKNVGLLGNALFEKIATD